MITAAVMVAVLINAPYMYMALKCVQLAACRSVFYVYVLC